MCYDNNSNNCLNYGRLYTLGAATTSCPNGWRVPTASEWTTLINFLGGVSQAGGALKSTSVWNAPNTGATNSSGFNALPAGHFIASLNFYLGINTQTGFWTSDVSGNEAIAITLSNTSSQISSGSLNYSENFVSCRCIKD